MNKRRGRRKRKLSRRQQDKRERNVSRKRVSIAYGGQSGHIGQLDGGSRHDATVDDTNDVLSNENIDHYDGANQTGDTSSNSSSDVMCIVCNDNDDGQWIQCDLCDKWCHIQCVDLTKDAAVLIENLDWCCPTCSGY